MADDPSPRAPRLFLSYASVDRDAARLLVETVAAAGHDIWFDRLLLGGTVWWTEILERIRQADMLVLAVSESSVLSPACTAEWTYALALGTPVVPVLVADFPHAALPSELLRRHLIDGRPGASGCREELLRVIQALPAAVPRPAAAPATPAVPLPDLATVSDRLRWPHLGAATQQSIVSALRTAMRRDDDAAAAGVLIRVLQARSDLYRSTHESLAKIPRPRPRPGTWTRADIHPGPAPAAGRTDAGGRAVDTGEVAGPDPERLRFVRRTTESLGRWLTESTSGTVELSARFTQRPSAVERPLDGVAQRVDAGRTLPAELGIEDVFEGSGGIHGEGLLLLGGPGSGKTTELLRLALYMLALSGDEPDLPLPVYLTVGTYAPDDGTFADWIVAQLVTLYWVHERHARRWTEEQAVLPLVDGLDEIADVERRERCVARINEWVAESGRPAVVCSRTAEYTDVGLRLRLGRAVTIDPLDAETARRSLARGGERGAAALAALDRDPEIARLATTALFLTLLVSSASAQAEQVTARAVSARGLIAGYIEAQLQPPAAADGGRGYPPQETRRWLGTLARQLTEHHQTVFLLDQVDADWLPHRWVRVCVLGLPSLLFGVVFGLTMGLTEATQGLPRWLLAGIAGGLVAGLTQSRRALGVALAVVGGAAFAMTAAAGTAGTAAVAYGLLYACAFGVLSGTRRDDRRPTEVLHWSARKALRAGPRTMVVTLALALVYSAVLGAVATHGVHPPPRAVIASAVLVAGLFALLSGLTQGGRTTHVSPNEGIRRSARNGGTVLAVTGFVLVPVCAVVGGLNGVDAAALLFGFAYGSCVALIFGLSAGLGAVIHHWATRVLLWGYGLGPIDYARWLRHMNARRIVYWSVGGGYVFVHGLIRELLETADLECPEPQGIALAG